VAFVSNTWTINRARLAELFVVRPAAPPPVLTKEETSYVASYGNVLGSKALATIDSTRTMRPHAGHAASLVKFFRAPAPNNKTFQAQLAKGKTNHQPPGTTPKTGEETPTHATATRGDACASKVAATTATTTWTTLAALLAELPGTSSSRPKGHQKTPYTTNCLRALGIPKNKEVPPGTPSGPTPTPPGHTNQKAKVNPCHPEDLPLLPQFTQCPHFHRT
jgi:hypothetical protein